MKSILKGIILLSLALADKKTSRRVLLDKGNGKEEIASQERRLKANGEKPLKL